MKVIYEPRGAALEYSPLAVNLYSGCTHGCKYCYVPKCLRQTPERFHSSVSDRNILKQLEEDCAEMRESNDSREVLLCFTCDPYHNGDTSLTRKALELFDEYRIKAQILTKGGTRACRDFDLILKNGWKFATTLVFSKEASRREWEPNAAPLADRVEAIKRAHALGIKTWVSIEPVIYPGQALYIIERLSDFVDFWKVGKINHFPEIERQADWKQFTSDVIRLIPPEKRLIKASLQKYM